MLTRAKLHASARGKIDLETTIRSSKYDIYIFIDKQIVRRALTMEKVLQTGNSAAGNAQFL
jgi:hypothetical protein